MTISACSRLPPGLVGGARGKVFQRIGFLSATVAFSGLPAIKRHALRRETAVNALLGAWLERATD